MPEAAGACDRLLTACCSPIVEQLRKGSLQAPQCCAGHACQLHTYTLKVSTLHFTSRAGHVMMLTAISTWSLS